MNYNVVKYARSLIREFGRKDEKSIVKLWLADLDRKPKDGYLDYFYRLLNRIYFPEYSIWQEYVHEHICRIFDCYPKLISNQKYPAFSVDSDQLICYSQLKLLNTELNKNHNEKELKALNLDIAKLKEAINNVKINKVNYPKRIYTVNFDGYVISRFTNLDIPFYFNPCELKDDIVGSATAAILIWRINNPLASANPVHEPSMQPLPKNTYYVGEEL